MFDFLGCQIDVPPQNMSAVVRTESSAQRFAVGIVGYSINRQPANKNEADRLVSELKEKGINYSVGIAQVNQSNFNKYGLNTSNMFDVCTNLSAGSKILKSCYETYGDWSKAYSCYYSGNPSTGFRDGYVQEVLRNIKKPILVALNKKNEEKSLEELALNPIRLSPKYKNPNRGVRNLVAKKKGRSMQTANNAESKPLTLRQRRLASSLSVNKTS